MGFGCFCCLEDTLFIGIEHYLTTEMRTTWLRQSVFSARLFESHRMTCYVQYWGGGGIESKERGFTHISFMSHMATVNSQRSRENCSPLQAVGVSVVVKCWMSKSSLGCQDQADMKTFCCVLLWSTASKKHIPGLRPRLTVLLK